jgi:hypothetical protein
MPPKRRRVRRHSSDEVQGDGSWVVVVALTVAEMREFRKRGEEEGFDAFELGVEVLQTHVREWNWVDDDGQPFPQPKDDPSVIDLLTDDEVAFLSSLIQGSEAEAKN